MKISEIQAGLRSLNVAVDVDDLQRYLDSARISVEDVTEATIEAIADEIKKVQSTAIAPTTPSTAITPKRKGGKLAKVKQDNSIAPHAQQVQTNPVESVAVNSTNQLHQVLATMGTGLVQQDQALIQQLAQLNATLIATAPQRLDAATEALVSQMGIADPAQSYLQRYSAASNQLVSDLMAEYNRGNKEIGIDGMGFDFVLEGE